MGQLKVLVVGAGIAGNALAFWLSKLGHAVTIIERHHCLRTNGLQLDLRGNGIEVMRRMGLEQAVRAKCVPEDGMELVDSSGRRRAFFAANKSGKGAQSVSSEFEIMRKDLCVILHDAAEKFGAKYVFGTTVESFQWTGNSVEASFADGKKEIFDLMVGCDGQGSRIRRLMLGDGSAGQAQDPIVTLGERIAYYTIPRPAKQEGAYIATTYLMPEKRFVITRRHNLQEMQVYLRCEAHSGPMEGVKRGDVKAEKEAFAKMFESSGWETDDLVKALKEGGEDFYCQYSSLVRMDSWSRGCVTLVGDAGYCCPPDGFGTSVALIGAYILAGEIQRCCPAKGESGGNDADNGVQAALQGYEQRFQPYMKRIQAKYSTEPSSFDKIPWTPLTVGIFYRLAGIVSFLKLDRIASRLMPLENTHGWKLPEYPQMIKG
ncbi:uncharacterized protein Z518_11198 [Rhinocladiella mackenziei CBS 650.93]|uniref:Rhinocladiella mackenziei CBS 650.93 unplaced genomic scaffold supercont1.12, whole genome shotgun sequence n=1 Tax=Rhinocladiella mackenziei CBS 650.93 TaxID=1442369 RepID=A0A0D2IRW0_9EURO|nr:uncharacterized protein Z518_11198 [Rhinocladiella mackenziei CBS 650.93]KIW99459.1 hypothetical protein Z518_11198 [Rhinocladiella mackenziei CBS 650.93]